MKVTILATSDIHSVNNPHLINEWRTHNGEEVIKIDNGDFFSGTKRSLMEFVSKKKSSMIDFAKKMAYDVMVPGNHDLDYGLSWLRKTVADVGIPYICANLIDNKGNLVFDAYKVIEKQGVRVLVIGIMNEALSQQLSPKRMTEINILPIVPTVKRIITEVESDIIIVAYHGGLTKNPFTNEVYHYPSMEDGLSELMTALPDIHLWIAGHQHFSRVGINVQKSCAYIQPPSHAKAYGICNILKSSDGIELSNPAIENLPCDNNLIDDYYPTLYNKIIDHDIFESWVASRWHADRYFLNQNSPIAVESYFKNHQGPYGLYEYHIQGNQLNGYVKGGFVKENMYKILTDSPIFSNSRLTRCIVVNLLEEFFIDQELG